MLQPRPALADRIRDLLRAGTVGDISARQIDHEQAAIGIDRDMAFTAHGLLAGIIASNLGRGRLH